MTVSKNLISSARHKISYNSMISLIKERNSFAITWFDHWHPKLDEALEQLPELDACPHELFRLLVQNPVSARKRTALITERGVPVAVVGLRQRGAHSWDLVTQWIVPGGLYPAKPGYQVSALTALQVDVWVGWWRMERPPPPSPLIRYSESKPTYRMRCAEDHEAYWRQTSHFKTVRQNRNRCSKFALAVNPPGGAEWVINRWGAKWQTNPLYPDPSLSDRIVAAKYLEKHGRYFSLLLLDQENPIGGATLSVHQKDLVAGVLYRDPEYESYGVGGRLIDLSFAFASESSFETLDIGGLEGYKKYWAPEAGARWWFNLCPEPLFRVKQISERVRHVRGKAMSWINKRARDEIE